MKKSNPQSKGSKDSDGNVEEDTDHMAGSGLFCCPVDGCIKVFKLHSNLENHLTCGKCTLHLEKKRGLLDQAKLLYTEKVSEDISAQPTLTVQASYQAEEVAPLTQGWALKRQRKAARFTEDQRKYLDDKFQIGQETGHKADPEKVAKEMRYARDESGQRRFKVEEFLTVQQIQSFFSRSAAKLRRGIATEPQDDVEDNIQAAVEEEAAFCSARQEILAVCEPVHPIVYDTYNICTLYSTNKISTLSVAKLKEICMYFKHG